MRATLCRMITPSTKDTFAKSRPAMRRALNVSQPYLEWISRQATDLRHADLTFVPASTLRDFRGSIPRSRDLGRDHPANSRLREPCTNPSKPRRREVAQHVAEVTFQVRTGISDSRPSLTAAADRPLPLQGPSATGQLRACLRSLVLRTTGVRCIAAGDDMIDAGLWRAGPRQWSFSHTGQSPEKCRRTADPKGVMWSFAASHRVACDSNEQFTSSRR